MLTKLLWAEIPGYLSGCGGIRMHCGECCRDISPFGNPCPYLEQRSTFFFCSIYDRRSEECRNHTYPFKICPVGMEKLSLIDDDISLRIETGWAMLEFNTDDPDEAINLALRSEQ